MKEIAEPMTPEQEQKMLDMWRSSADVREFLPPGFPTVVTLCGSTRFIEEFLHANLEETLAGKIVLSVGCDTKSNDGLGLSEDAKARLDVLHFRKIDISDEILVINKEVIVCDLCGKPTRLFTESSCETECCRTKKWHREKYTGESTRNEIAYAERSGKRVRYRF